MKRIFRTTFVILGIFSFILTIAFFVQLPLLTSILPSTSSFPLHTFLASITASITASLLWIGFSGELGAAAGGAIDLAVFYAGLTIFQLHSHQYGSHRFPGHLSVVPSVSHRGSAAPALAPPYLFCGIRRGAPACRECSPLAGAQCVCLATQRVVVGHHGLFLPWFNMLLSVRPLYTALAQRCGQLWSFLAYDIVLIFPFLLHFTTISPVRLPSLIVNTIILVYSGTLALYYLLIKKETRSRLKIKSLLSQAKPLEWSR